MGKRDEIKKLWCETFGDSREWTDMFFSRVWRDDDAVVLDDESGKVVSAMSLQRYAMTFHGREVGVSYICGAMTRRQDRGQGHMSRLIETALKISRDRGDMVCTLIPAESHLYPFYARKGFATVFYVRDLRFTALHPFSAHGDFQVVDDLYAPAVYDAFSRFEHSLDGSILHSQRDFLNILDDSRVDGGHVAAVADDEGRVAGIGFAVEREGIAVVTELMGDSREARYAVLRQLRSRYADLPFKVRRPAGPAQIGLTPRAMARVVNVGMVLETIAAANPRLRATVRVTDPIISENSHIFSVAKGQVVMDDTLEPPYTLDVVIDVFTKIIFSAPAVGALVGLPSVRPHISLMLD